MKQSSASSGDEKDKLVSLIMRLDQSTMQYRQESGKTVTDIEELHAESMALQQQQRQELLHMETVNMMSKY